jgi:N-acetylglucosamine repressor
VELNRHEARILQAIALLPRPTRRDIAVRADLSMVVVSATLAGLLERGHVTRTPTALGKGGRPAHVYSVSGGVGTVAGVFISPERVHLVCLDASRARVHAESIPLALSKDPSRHVAEIVDAIVRVVDNGPCRDTARLIHVGVTLPGVTDADRGMWVRGFQVSGVRHVSMRSMLEARLGVPVLIEDPARAAAWRELREGRGVGAQSFVLLYLDYGVGAGVVVGGELYRGRDGLSGEVGHLVVDPDGYRCSCGDVGCLETVASTSGILRCVRDRLAEGVLSSLSPAFARDPVSLALEDVLRAADAGDRLAQSTLYEIGERIGAACATVVKLVNPERLIVGGTGAMFARYFEPRVRMTMEKHVIPEMLAELPVSFCDPSPENEAHGVALMSLERYWSRRVADLEGAAGMVAAPDREEAAL